MFASNGIHKFFLMIYATQYVDIARGNFIIEDNFNKHNHISIPVYKAKSMVESA